MKILKFEEIIAWQKAQDLAVNIYSHFKLSRDWDFRSQICRATVSIQIILQKGLIEIQILNSEGFCISL